MSSLNSSNQPEWKPKPEPSKILKPHLDFNPDEIKLNLLTKKDAEKNGVMWVVMDEHCTTVVKMPGLEKPFSTLRYKHAEMVAKETGGVAVKYREALKLVMSSPCNLPKDSKHYNPDKRAAKIKLGLKG